MVNILLAEDHNLVRQGIRKILEQESDFKVIAEASTGVEALFILRSGLQVDVVLTDISMPEMDGLTLAKAVREEFLEIKIVVLSMMDHENYLLDAFAAGVNGYLLKNTSFEEMTFTIKHTVSGYNLMCAELGLRMLKKVQRNTITQIDTGIQAHLSTRELEVLALIAEGYTSHEIADKIFTSSRTVEGHRKSLIEKTGVKNTAQLIRFGCKAGLI